MMIGDWLESVRGMFGPRKVIRNADRRRYRGQCFEQWTVEALEERCYLSASPFGSDLDLAVAASEIDLGESAGRDETRSEPIDSVADEMWFLPPDYAGELPDHDPSADTPTTGTGNQFNVTGYQWPQPNGDGSPLTLTYSYSNLLDGGLGGSLDTNQLTAAVEEALGLWASVAPLHFVEVVDSGPAPSESSYSASGVPHLRIGHHYIDGGSGANVLAHAYYPSGGGLGGDVHFDNSNTWTVMPSGGIDIIEVSTHEIGHSLGLGHESTNVGILNPYYGRHYNGPGTAFLYQDDIDGIRAIYGTGVGSVTPLEHNGGSADDHGDNSSSATTIGISSTTAGVIEEAGDQDWFRFQANAGITYSFQTSLDTLADSTLTLYDQNGTSVLRFDDDGGAGLASQIEWTASASGSYFLKVAAYNSSQTGSYSLSVTAVDDHGNNASAATVVNVGSTTAAAIEVGGDQDWFRFQATGGATYRFETTLESLPDSTLTLYDQNGSTQLRFDDDGGAGLASLIQWTATDSGTYFLNVAAYSSTQTGSYTLYVSQTSVIGTPSTVSPTGTITSPTPDFQWTGVIGAARYDLQVLDLTAGQTEVIRLTNLTGTSFTPTNGLTVGHSFRWSVRAMTGAGQAGQWSTARDFTVEGEAEIELFEAESDLHHQIGRQVGNAWSANTRNDSRGFMSFGPYTTQVSAGTHTATFRLLVDNNSHDNAEVVTLDVFNASTGQLLAQRALRRGEFDNPMAYQDFDLNFSTTAEQRLEFRTLWHDTSYVQQDWVKVVSSRLPATLVFEAESDFHHQIGRQVGNAWSANTRDDSRGFMSFGPYTTQVSAGTHTATFRLLVDNNSHDNAEVVTLDVFNASTGQLLAQRALRRGEFDNPMAYQDFDLNFSTTAEQRLEFRTLWHDTSYVQQDWVKVVSNGTSSAIERKQANNTVENPLELSDLWSGYGLSETTDHQSTSGEATHDGTADGSVLYVNFEGASLSRNDLERWAGTDWRDDLDEYIDPEQDGIQVQAVSPDADSHEEFVDLTLSWVQQKLNPLGIQVERHTGSAVEGVGATTVFVGKVDIVGVLDEWVGMASDVDIGNDNSTDIAFVLPIWGNQNLRNSALATANLILHEAGHTWGLTHVDAGATAEIMGLDHSDVGGTDPLLREEAAFLNVEFSGHADHGRNHHGQNSYATLTSLFVAATNDNQNQAVRTSSIEEHLQNGLLADHFGREFQEVQFNVRTTVRDWVPTEAAEPVIGLVVQDRMAPLGSVHMHTQQRNPLHYVAVDAESVLDTTTSPRGHSQSYATQSHSNGDNTPLNSSDDSRDVFLEGLSAFLLQSDPTETDTLLDQVFAELENEDGLSALLLGHVS